MTTHKKCVTCNFVVLLRETSTNSLLKKMFLERFDEQLPFFKVNMILMDFVTPNV